MASQTKSTMTELISRNTQDSSEKTAVRVPSKQISYFMIHLTKINGPEHHDIEKRFSEFFEFHLSIKKISKIWEDLPKFPNRSFKKLLTESDLNKRRDKLETYLNEILKSSVLLNLEETVKFLQLDYFAPELIIERPTLIQQFKFEQSRVQFLKFCDHRNILILLLNPGEIIIVQFSEDSTENKTIFSEKLKYDVLSFEYSAIMGLIMIGFSNGAIGSFLIKS